MKDGESGVYVMVGKFVPSMLLDYMWSLIPEEMDGVVLLWWWWFCVFGVLRYFLGDSGVSCGKRGRMWKGVGIGGS